MRVIAFTLIGLGAVLTAANWGALIASGRENRHISPFFPAASLLTLAGLALLPATRPYAWLALLTDYTLFAMAIALPKTVLGAWRTSRFTLVRLFEASDPPRQFRLSLHRGGYFLVSARFAPPVRANRRGALIQSFGAAGRWAQEPGGFRLTDYQDSRILQLRRRDRSTYVSDEANYPKDKEFPYDSMQSLEFREVTSSAT